MKILILSQYYLPEVGAAPTRLAATCRELKKMGHEIEVLTAMPNYPVGKIFQGYRNKFSITETIEDTLVHRIWAYPAVGKSLGRIFHYLSFAILACFALFRVSRPDVIFVNSGPLFVAIPALFAKAFWRVPFIFNVADLWPDSIAGVGTFPMWALKPLYWLEYKAYTQACLVNGATHGVCRVLEIEKGLPPSKIKYLPNGVDTTLFTPAPIDPELQKQLNPNSDTLFCYPGTHGFLHKLDSVLTAAKLLMEHPIKILFIGGGSEKEALIARAKDENINNVIFISPVSQVELVRYISISDFGLIHQRNTPLANDTRPAKVFPLAAMAKPILFAGFGEGAELVKRAHAGVVIPPEDPQRLAETMIELSKNRLTPEIQELGSNGRELIVSQYSWEKIISEWWISAERDITL